MMKKVYFIFIFLIPITLSLWNEVPVDVIDQLDKMYDIIFPKHSKAPISQFGFAFNPSTLEAQSFEYPNSEWTILIDGDKKVVRIKGDQSKFREKLEKFDQDQFIIVQMMDDQKKAPYHSESIILEVMNTYEGLKSKCQNGFYLFTKFMPCTHCTQKLLLERQGQAQPTFRSERMSQLLKPFVPFTTTSKFYLLYSFQFDEDKLHYENLLKFQISNIFLVRYGYNSWKEGKEGDPKKWNPKSIQERALEEFKYKNSGIEKIGSLLNMFHDRIKNRKSRLILFFERILFPLCNKICGGDWDLVCWRTVMRSLETECYITNENSVLMMGFKSYLENEAKLYQDSMEKVLDYQGNKDKGVVDALISSKQRYRVPMGPLSSKDDIFIDEDGTVRFADITNKNWCGDDIESKKKQYTIFCQQPECQQYSVEYNKNANAIVAILVDDVIRDGSISTTTAEETAQVMAIISDSKEAPHSTIEKSPLLPKTKYNNKNNKQKKQNVYRNPDDNVSRKRKPLNDGAPLTQPTTAEKTNKTPDHKKQVPKRGLCPQCNIL